jgi:glycosyltransferase involved in cell wall biosynthesis/SAM-dependent methyltransferase
MARRVLMLVAGGIGHDSRVRRSARTLAHGGYDVTVSVATTPDAPPDRSEHDGYRVVHAPLVETLRKGRHVDQPYRLPWAAVIRQEEPDVVHVHDYHGLGTAVKVARPGTRIVFDAHEHVVGKVSARRREALGLYLRRNVRRVDAVVTVGKELANVLTRELDLREAPLVLHNAPSLRDARPAPYDLRVHAGVRPDEPLIVYAGAQSKRRALDTPIRALPALPGVHLAFVFPVDKASAQLAEVAERHGVRDRVHFLPPVAPDAVASLLRGADVGLNPLHRHPNGDVAMPNKLFEYLHAGIPMVVSESPAMAHFVRKYRLGEVAPVDDPEAWARSIERVLASPAAYAGDPGARAVLKHGWSWEAQEPKLLKMYARLLATTDVAWYDRVYETSAAYRVRYSESVYFAVWQVVVERLRSCGARSVLDIGCGPGQFASLLRDSGIERYLGIDLSHVAVKRARKICPEFDFRVDDARTSDVYDTHAYDCAVCLETLEDLDEDREVVRRFPPGTRLVATVPNFEHASHRRYFASVDEVRARYGAVFGDVEITPLPLRDHTLFLLDGFTARSKDGPWPRVWRRSGSGSARGPKLRKW